MEIDFKVDTIALRKIMAEKEINTLSALSSKSGVNRNTISKLLNSNIRPSLKVMDKIVATLEIEPKEAGKIFFTQYLRN